MGRGHQEAYRQLIARLRAARLAADLTQEQAAGHLGITQTQLSKIERVERRIDPIELRDLAHLYGTTASALLNEPE